MKKILLYCFLMSFITSCGFKVADKSQFNNFKIQNVSAVGDKRVNFKIRNFLLNNDKETSENIIFIKLNTKKTKSVKEKNLKNEITKYQIVLNTKLDVEMKINNLIFDISSSVSGNYLVGENYSTSLSNERKLTDDLIETLSKQILNKINTKLNDL